jgi:signal transduction histidine kinase
MTESLKILLVEDDEDDYVLAQDRLSSTFGSDARLDWASTWEKGLAAIDRAEHDVYLVDLQLGARTGLELVREAIRKGCAKPIILLTGQDSPDIDLEAVESGATDYIVKSQITADQLARSIRYGIKQKSSENKLRENERDLQVRIDELEDAQRKLKQQGADLVSLADDLKISHDQAQFANRSKSEFLAAMSHELRTPLNAIIGFSEIIKDQLFGPVGNKSYCDYASDINDSGQHLLHLINDLLDLSKVESGTEELHEENIDVEKLIDSAATLVKLRAEKGEVAIEAEFTKDLPLLYADERKLIQILVNLLSNAVKFTDPGGKVTIRTWYNEGGGFVVQVMDTGIGIASEDIPKALSQFGQVDSDLNRRYEGTGLGLPLTKALVELHGGYIDLQSEVGVGTTATIRFPTSRIVKLQDKPQKIAAGFDANS